MTDRTSQTPPRSATGRFVPGRSGNPKGRRPGVKNKRDKLREQLESYSEEALEVLIAKVRAGDPMAMRLYWDRVLPILRPSEATKPMPTFEGDLTARAESLLESVQKGELTSDQARNAAQMLASTAMVLKDGMLARLEAVESAVREQADDERH